MRRLLSIAILLTPFAASAKELTVTMPEEAWPVVINALNLQVKQEGLAAADNAIFIRNAIQAAAKAAQEAKPAEEPKK